MVVQAFDFTRMFSHQILAEVRTLMMKPEASTTIEGNKAVIYQNTRSTRRDLELLLFQYYSSKSINFFLHLKLLFDYASNADANIKI